MIYLFKKYGWLMILVCLVNLPILIFGSIRTDQTVTLKGDTTKVENFVEIDQAFTSSGSFSTIYVISFDHSTILQNWLLSASTTATLATISDSTNILRMPKLGQWDEFNTMLPFSIR